MVGIQSRYIAMRKFRGEKLVHQRQTSRSTQQQPSQRLRQASLLARTEAPCWAPALGRPVSAWAELAWQSDQQAPLKGLTGHDRPTLGPI